MQTPLTFLAAFIVVLALIALAAWLVRRFSGGNLRNNANRGRMPRLAVIDAAAVDGRRRLVLVRRDNVEHLLMIGGPTDVVVELNIVRAMPARDGAPQRPGELPRTPALPDAPGWTDGTADDLDAVEPAVELPLARRGAPSFADEVRRPVPPPERRNSEPTSLAPELPPSRPEPPARPESRVDPAMPRPPRPPRPESPPRADNAPRPRLAETLSRLPRGPDPTTLSGSAAPAAPFNSAADADKELTDMAQRLEAALRRPSAPPVTAQSSSSAEASASSSAPAVEPPRPPRPTASAPPVNAPDAPLAAATNGRRGFENLEDEMASLLGRPKSPT